MQGAMTNMINSHTCPTCNVDLLVAVILVMDGQLLQFTSDIICGAIIHVPIAINPVGCCG